MIALKFILIDFDQFIIYFYFINENYQRAIIATLESNRLIFDNLGEKLKKMFDDKK